MCEVNVKPKQKQLVNLQDLMDTIRNSWTKWPKYFSQKITHGLGSMQNFLVFAPETCAFKLVPAL